MNAQKHEVLLSAHDVVERLGMSLRWVYEQAERWDKGDQEGLQSVRFGRKRRFRPSVVDAYIERHSQPPPNNVTGIQKT